MKKTISLRLAILLIVIAVLLTLEAAFIFLGGWKKESESQKSDFISKAENKLEELDRNFRAQYIGEIDDEKVIEYMLTGYIYGTGDAYAEYYTEDAFNAAMSDMNGSLEGIGVSVIYNAELGAIEILRVYPDSPAEKAKVKEGEFILYVGEEKLRVSEIGYYAAINAVRGKAGEDAYIYVSSDGSESSLKEYVITRAAIDKITVSYHQCEEDSSVGIIEISEFDSKTPEQFKNAVNELVTLGCSKFVFDVRNNPGGELNSVVSVLDFILPEGPVIRIFDKNDNEVNRMNSDESHIDYPIAILTNSNTASAAELFTSAIKDYEMGISVGTKTYGKGCMQTTVQLSDGSAYKVTYRFYKPPFSESYHGTGIEPDIDVELSEEASGISIYKLADKDDNQLMAAVKELQK